LTFNSDAEKVQISDNFSKVTEMILVRTISDFDENLKMSGTKPETTDN